MRYKRLPPGLIPQLVRFGIVGMINTAIGIVISFGLTYMGTAPALANVAGFGGGLCTSFVLNRRWTFEDKSDGRLRVMKRFLIVFAVCYLLNLAAVEAGIRIFAFNPYVMQLVGMAIYTTTSFLGFKLFTFRPTLSSPSSENCPTS
jgi:putative flippase GtrA